MSQSDKANGGQDYHSHLQLQRYWAAKHAKLHDQFY